MCDGSYFNFLSILMGFAMDDQGFSDQILGIFVSSEAVKSIAPYPFMYAASDLIKCACVRVRNGWLTKNSSWDMENISTCIRYDWAIPIGEDFGPNNSSVRCVSKPFVESRIDRKVQDKMHLWNWNLARFAWNRKNIGFEFHFQTEASPCSRCFALV